MILPPTDSFPDHNILEPKTEGLSIWPPIYLDPPRVGGVKVAPETSMKKMAQNVGIVVKRPRKRESAGRNMPIWTNPDPDPAKPNKEISNSCTMSRAPKEPKTNRAQPS